MRGVARNPHFEIRCPLGRVVKQHFSPIFCYLAPPHSQSASLPDISQLCEMGLHDFLLHVTMDAC